MSSADVTTGTEPHLAPHRILDFLPSTPSVSSGGLGWDRVVVHRFVHPPCRIQIIPPRDHLMVVYLGAPVLIEGRVGDGRMARRWSERGDMSLMPAGLPIERALRSRADVMLVHLATSLVQEVSASAYGTDPSRLVLTPCLPTSDRNIDILGRLLLEEAEVGDVGSRLGADCLARALVTQLLRRHSNFAHRPPEKLPPIHSARLRRVLDYMQTHVQDPIRLDELAALSGLSTSHFARAFRAAVGEPPHRHLLGLRLRRACDLLERTTVPIIEVAFLSGFESPNHFATMFRKAVGMSPRSWRVARR